jgi:hypothetical protein
LPRTNHKLAASLHQNAFRNSIAVGCLAGAIWLHYAGTIDFLPGMVIWLLLAAGAGYMVLRGWFIAVAPLPWIAGIGGGVLTGRYESLGEAWFMSLLISTIAGVIGIIIGAAARQGRGRPHVDV